MTRQLTNSEYAQEVISLDADGNVIGDDAGQTFTLFASAARGAGAAVLGTAVDNPGRVAIAWLLDVTAAATEASDTLDCYIDALVGATWINIAHFTQVLGNGGALARFCVNLPTNMTTTDLVADCAAGVCRGLVGSQFRGRYTLVDGGGSAASFTFSLKGYAI